MTAKTSEAERAEKDGLRIDVEDVLLWPDGTYCYRHELQEMTHKSDDYVVLFAGSKKWKDFFYE